MKGFIQVSARLVESHGVFNMHVIAVDSIAMVAPFGEQRSRIVLKATVLGSGGQVVNEAVIADRNANTVKSLIEEALK